MSLPGRFLELDGGLRLFVHRQGTPGRKALLFVHGYLDSHYGWRLLLPALAEDHDVLALDLPGFGESDRPATFGYDVPGFAEVCHRALDRLDVDRLALIGHSLGGAVILEMARMRPGRVERLLAIAPALYPTEPPLRGRIALAPVIGPIVFKHLYSRRDVRAILRDVFFRDPRFVTEALVDYFWDRLNRRGGREAAHRTLQAIYGAVAPEPERLQAIACPLLVLWGEEDRAQPLENGRRLVRDRPGTELRIVPGAGHLPQLERPRVVLRHARPFLLDGSTRQAAAAR